MKAEKIYDLFQKTNYLIDTLIPLGGGNKKINDIIKELEKLRRRSFIISLLNEKYTFAITGLQGVGKSHFLNNIYNDGTGEDYFIENLGEGETLPTLVTESEEPNRYFVHRAITQENGTTKIVKVKIEDLAEFHQIAHAYDQNDLLLEVTVPFKVFNNDQVSFILLPGFRMDNDYLYELTKSALMTSINSIVVFDSHNYQDRRNEELFNELRQNYNDSSLIYLISRSDLEDSNIEFQNKVRQELGIENDHQVLRIGKPGPSNWKESVIESIKSLRNNNRNDAQRIQNNNISKLVYDYNDTLARVREGLNHLSTSIENQKYEVLTSITKAYTDEVQEIRRLFKSRLEEDFDAYFSHVKDCLTEKLIYRYADDVTGYLKGLIESLFTPNIKIKSELIDLIDECIENSNENSIETEFNFVLNRISNEKWQERNIRLELPVNQENHENMYSLIGKNNQDIELDDNTLQDLTTLINPTDEQRIFSPELRNSIKTIPLIVLEKFRLSRWLNDVEIPEIEKRSLVDHYIENKPEFAKTIGALLGLDILEGGGVDVFGLLSKNSTPITNEAGASVAAASFSWASAAIATGIIIAFLHHQYLQHVDNVDTLVGTEINSYKNRVIQNALSNYDETMGKIGDLLNGLLVQKYGLDRSFSNIQNSIIMHSNLERACTEIEREIRRNIF